MEGKLLLIVILALVTDFSAGFPHRHHHHRNSRRHPNNICKSPGLKLAFSLLQRDTEDIKHNIRCRMDPGTCSESMLATSGEARTPFQLNDICNENFLHNLRVNLTQFYTHFKRIHAHITRLQSDFFLSTAYPLHNLTNELSHDIWNAVLASEPNVALSRPLTEISTSTSVESGEMVMLEDLIQTINTFDRFITNVNNILIHQ